MIRFVLFIVIVACSVYLIILIAKQLRSAEDRVECDQRSKRRSKINKGDEKQ